MKRNLLLCIICFALGCGTLQVKTSTQFSDDELSRLLGISQTVGIDCSYDYEMNLWCFYSQTAAPALTDAKALDDEKKMTDAIDKADEAALRPLYEKVYRNYYAMQYMKDYYFKRKQWKYYNVLTKTVMPQADYFLYLSERIFAKKKPDTKTYLDGRKASLNREAVAATIERLSVVGGFN